MTGAGWALELELPGGIDLAETLQRLVDDRVASRIAAHDASLWGEEAKEEAAKRLGWTDLHERSRPLVAPISALRRDFADAGITRIVLCGMGGSSLAPEVICTAADRDLEMLDSSSPDVVRRALAGDLHRTVVVVSSKSGGTVETDSHRRSFEAAFRAAGIDPAQRIVVVTDPGSPLDEQAMASGFRVFHADPMVGGRYSALSAFGLVPSGLAGVDIERLLDEAASVAPATADDDPDNPILRLGALLALAVRAGVDKAVLADTDADRAGLGSWIEQLVAESTGKEGTGVLPISVPSTHAPNFDPSTPDCVLCTWGEVSVFDRIRPASGFGAHLCAPLGAQFLIWEGAVAVASRLLEINPFDQPDVESAKAAAREMLSGDAPQDSPTFVDGPVQVFAGDWLPPEVADARSALRALLTQIDPVRGYLSIQAYLDDERDGAVAGLRESLATRTGRPVTFGWAPRFLHSTGQYHKGGPQTGVFLQLSCDPEADLEIPGREFTFAEFQASQAVGDAHVLSRRGRPVLRFHASSPAGFAEWLNSLL
ncbi:glucose-6-phosphate isomerase [Nocardioides daejeonensis]|uniref:glucose-6-phosphate isomerase n=1 Tax=Nocardioides daejeonensis TaxID=1046556 RepID=UPI001EF414F6|nr:glucose-6-phosphate isomerase [Nocardioides daejeonensis]